MKRLLYRALDHDGEVLAVIAAPTREEAEAYFLGADLYPHSVQDIDPDGNHLSRLIIVIATQERHVRSETSGLPITVRTIVK